MRGVPRLLQGDQPLVKETNGLRDCEGNRLPRFSTQFYHRQGRPTGPPCANALFL